VINIQYETPAREHYWSFEPDRQLASRHNVGISFYKITQNQGVVDPPNTHDKDSRHDENVQAEINAENSNPLSTVGGNPTEVTVKAIKRCRFRRRALRFMIGRYLMLAGN
jgi:hypothetical protein